MTRVTGFKCIYQSNGERFKFALTLADAEAGDADFVVSDPDAAETLLDMFEDASEADFDPATGELAFTFAGLEAQEDGEDDVEETEQDEEAEAEEEGDAEAYEQALDETASERKVAV